MADMSVYKQGTRDNVQYLKASLITDQSYDGTFLMKRAEETVFINTILGQSGPKLH